nr:centrosomal protein kizuna isoform X4 [Columba livia]
MHTTEEKTAFIVGVLCETNDQTLPNLQTPPREAKRLELERKLMEYVQSDAYQIKMKRMKLQKYLKEIEERQKRARVRNQALLKEFDEFEAHLKTSNLEMSQKMEAWYERELKRASSLQEGGSSAAGDEEGAAEEQAGLLAITAPKQKEAKKCVWKPVLPQMKGALPSQAKSFCG